MRIIARRTLREFWTQRGREDSEQALKAWFREVERANWSGPAEVNAMYRSASLLGGTRVVFNICGNKYRLVVKVNYAYRVVYIRFVGTHAQYDKVNVREV